MAYRIAGIDVHKNCDNVQSAQVVTVDGRQIWSICLRRRGGFPHRQACLFASRVSRPRLQRTRFRDQQPEHKQSHPRCATVCRNRVPVL